MFEAIASFWHETVFWLMIIGWLIVCYDHADKLRAIFEWAMTKIKTEK